VDESGALHNLGTRAGNVAAVERLEEAVSVAVTGLRHSGTDYGPLGQPGRRARCCERGVRVSPGGRVRRVAAHISSTRWPRAVSWPPSRRMARVEFEGRVEEQRSGSPTTLGGLNLSREWRISPEILPCRSPCPCVPRSRGRHDAALEAAGGRNSPAAADQLRVPGLRNEADARGSLGSASSGWCASKR